MAPLAYTASELKLHQGKCVAGYLLHNDHVLCYICGPTSMLPVS